MADDNQPPDPVWVGWATAVGSLSATWMILDIWTDIGKSRDAGFGQFALLLVSPLIYGLVAVIVSSLLAFVLEQIEAPGVGMGTILGILAVMTAIRGTPAVWEIILAAVMALYAYGHYSRRAGDDR